MVAQEAFRTARLDSQPTEPVNTSSSSMENGNEVVRVTKGSETSILKSISVWIIKPHVVNRRLCGARILSVERFVSKELAEEALRKLKTCQDFSATSAAADASGGVAMKQSFDDLSEEVESYVLLVRELIPKSEFFPNTVEAVLYDKEAKSVRFVPLKVLDGCLTESGQAKLKTDELEYTLSFKETEENVPSWAQVNDLILTWSLNDDFDPERSEVRRQVTSQWLGAVLLDKLVNWSQVNDLSTSVTSLQLVSVDRYKETYVRLKNKYGRDLVKNWTENTDPQKFVYEDVAIAAYLMLIWEEDRKKKQLHRKQTFVDLGCGNGLLVYILTKEGHKGLGIDLRKRKIWDTFGPGIDLKEETITPSAEHLFPDHDWIIGNHSDELTPWIPVIAARSSYQCSFFVLPCCHHDFVGKFNSPAKSKSQYGAYLDHVKDIVAHCGFHPESDTLRIPSTKRVCFIGRSRSYDESMEPKVDIDRQSYIEKRIEMARKMSWGPGKQVKPSIKVHSDSEQGKPSDSNTRDQEGRECEGVDRGKLSVSVGGAKIENRMMDVEQSSGSGGGSGFSTFESQVSTDSGLGSWSSSCSSGRTSPTESMQIETNSPQIKEKCDCPSYTGAFRVPSTRVDPSENKRHWSSSTTPYMESTPTVNRGDSTEAHSEDKKFKGDHTATTATSTSSKPPDQSMVEKADEGRWASEFKPRVEQGVRNCQSVPDETKRTIVELVFQQVLDANTSARVDLGENHHWRLGGAVALSQIVTSLDSAILRDLKSECGGLQTLLRNHSHIFQVTGGMVRLRDFSKADPWQGRRVKKVNGQVKDKRKTMACWFFSHHPDGCPRDSASCSFAHGSHELRAK